MGEDKLTQGGFFSGIGAAAGEFMNNAASAIEGLANGTDEKEQLRSQVSQKGSSPAKSGTFNPGSRVEG
jgi:hypothetical protein